MFDSVPASSTDESQLDALTADLAALVGAKLRLYSAGFGPTRNTTHAEFVANEVTGTGYASAVLTWSAAAIGADGNYQAVSSRAFFQLTADQDGQSIGGAWLETSAGDLVDYYQLNGPIPFATALAFAAFVVTREPATGGSASVDW
jgi:hypothetical protein